MASQRGASNLVKSVTTFSVLSVVFGTMVLILSFAIARGFNSQITSKVVGFGSHVEVSHYGTNESFQQTPIKDTPKLRKAILSVDNVESIQPFATIASIVRGGVDIDMVVFKGIDKSHDTAFLSENMVEGRLLKIDGKSASNEIIISQTLAQKLLLKVGDKIDAFFVKNPIRRRKFTIVGIYNTSLSAFDKLYALCDIAQVQKLNDWDSQQVDGLEVSLKDFDQLEKTTVAIHRAIDYNLQAVSITDRSPDMFSWIGLIYRNVLVLILLIVVIVVISLITTQLIFILENIPTIGVLKTLGTPIPTIANAFMFVTARIMIWGLLVGNAVALFLCFVQSYFKLIKLDPKSYYMSYVPIQVQWLDVLFINVGLFVVSFIVLVFSAFAVSRNVKVVDAITLK